MMVTLFKSDAAGRLRFYTIHDLQRSLLSAYALTVSMAVGDVQGKDRILHFTSEEEAEKWLERTLRAKQRTGYRPLYRYASVRDNGTIVGRCLVCIAG